MNSISPSKVRPSFLEQLLDSRNGLTIFCLAISFFYGFVPLVAYFTLPVGEAFLQLSSITACVVVAMFVGSKIYLFDFRFRRHACRLYISARLFVVFVWCLFGIFIIVTFSTAPSIPLISAFQGASAEELSQDRGNFLKGREGLGIALLYLSTFLTNTVVPYSIVLLYAAGSRFRHVAALLFFLFCVSFMQKALFLNFVLPMIAYLAITRKLSYRVFFSIVFGSIILLVFTTFLSLAGETSVDFGFKLENYFSAQYSPSGPLDYLLWRAMAVPIFTATDTLVVFAEEFQSSPLLGATSSFIALVFNIERINIERFVFQYQFGSWNEIANANAVFVVDAYVNFGWIGVVCFGLTVGLIFRWFRISEDVAFRSLWVLFAFILFSAPLIGMLLSNGFIYMLIHALYLRVGRNYDGRNINVCN